jgi:uncharacterized membrane protein
MSTAVTSSESSAPTTGRRINWRTLSLILVVLGLLITGYLSYTRLFNQSVVCIGGSAGCDMVQSTVWSRFAGIPVAYLGFLTYVVIGGLLLLESRIGLIRDYGVMLVFGITLFGFIYQSYLTFVSIVQIQATCQWCLASHAVLTLLFLISARRLYLGMRS